MDHNQRIAVLIFMLKRFFRKFTTTDIGNIKNRLNRHYKILHYLQGFNENIHCNNGTFFFNDKIQIVKRLNPSKNNLLFIARGDRGISKLLKFALKITPRGLQHNPEVVVAKVLSKQVSSGQCIHFLLHFFNISFPPNPEHHNLNKPYDMTFTELADGDLHRWLFKYKQTQQSFISLALQLLFACCKLQRLSYLHNDLHSGNVLYHSIKAYGYWWYKIRDADYFVKNTGQLWMISDYGSISSIVLKEPYDFYSSDFIRILSIINQKKPNSFFTNNLYPICKKHTFLLDAVLYRFEKNGYVLMDRPECILNTTPFIL